MVEALSVDKIHNGINHPVLLDKVIHLRNIGMAQPFQHIHFPAQNLRLCIQIPFICFQYNLLVQPCMAPQIYDSASSGAYLFLYFINSCYHTSHACFPAFFTIYHLSRFQPRFPLLSNGFPYSCSSFSFSHRPVMTKITRKITARIAAAAMTPIPPQNNHSLTDICNMSCPTPFLTDNKIKILIRQSNHISPIDRPLLSGSYHGPIHISMI